MSIDIQFRGNKVVVIEVTPKEKIIRARELVRSALDGKFPFAWLQFKKPLPKDYLTNARSMKWARTHTYENMHDVTGVKMWRANLNTLRNALKILFRESEIEFYHVDGTGKLSVHYSSGKRVNLIPQKIPVMPSQRHPVSLQERALRKKGKVKVVSTIAHKIAVLKEVLTDLKEEERKQARLEDFGDTIDVVPHGEWDLRKGNPGISYLGNINVVDCTLPIDPPKLLTYEPDVRDQQIQPDITAGIWSYLCVLSRKRAGESNTMTNNMFSVYSKHLLSHKYGR